MPIMYVQLTAPGAKTSVRLRFRQNRRNPPETGRRPAREFRAPARFAS